MSFTLINKEKASRINRPNLHIASLNIAESNKKGNSFLDGTSTSSLNAFVCS